MKNLIRKLIRERFRLLREWVHLCREARNYSAAFGLREAVTFFYHWRKSVSGADSLSDRIPWITFQARNAVESVLRSDSRIFEYGSGGSTLYFADRVRELISVEHDRDWHQRVKSELAKSGVHNVDLHLVMPTDLAGVEAEDVDRYCSYEPPYAGKSFYDYVTLIDAYPDASFDLVFIDGRARPSCIRHAYSKVRFGGYLMLDNAERPHYQHARTLLSSWEEFKYFGPGPYNKYCWETVLWRRTTNGND